jgi:predicted Zn-dependent protease
MGRESEAIPMLEEEVRLFPDAALPRYYLGLFLLKAGRKHEGQRHWDEGLRRNPGDASLLSAGKRL